jgi:hypothetical protein
LPIPRQPWTALALRYHEKMEGGIMPKRVPWFLACLLLVLSLLLTSCGKSSEQPGGGGGGDVPKYGGALTLVATGDPMGFDEAFNAPWFAWSTHLTEDEMLNGDWTQGWAGGVWLKEMDLDPGWNLQLEQQGWLRLRELAGCLAVPLHFQGS